MVAYRKEKEAAEKQKLQEIQDSIKSTSNTQPLEELQKMDLDSEIIQKVQNSLQEDAKSKVTQIQGEYYETYD